MLSSDAINSSTALRAWPTRPAALIRGPSVKLMSRTVLGTRSMLATCSMVRMPGRMVLRSFRMPWWARMRFSPVMSTKSAPMLKANRSRWSYTEDIVSPMRFTNAVSNLNATPAPDSSLNG